MGMNGRTEISIEEVNPDQQQKTARVEKKPDKNTNYMHKLWPSMLTQVWLSDHRRVTHSLKVGLALSLVSLLLLLEDPYHHLGDNAIWAVMSVIVIFEYTAGATLSKGLNRGLGTLIGVILGLLVSFLANKTGPNVEPYIIGINVFILGSSATFLRFLPCIKAKFEYGVVIFILTYCLVVISGYRVTDSLDLVLDRLFTVFIGITICLAISLCLFPIWAGEDLHQSILTNFDCLSSSLQDCIKMYFRRGGEVLSEEENQRICATYKKILDSKQIEESLASFARWEPRLGNLLPCRYPWKRYVQVGEALRHCAYTVSLLDCCLHSKIHAPESFRLEIKNSCSRLVKEICGVIGELRDDIKKKQYSRPKELLLKKVNANLARVHQVLDMHPNLFGIPLPIIDTIDTNKLLIPPNTNYSHIDGINDIEFKRKFNEGGHISIEKSKRSRSCDGLLLGGGRESTNYTMKPRLLWKSVSMNEIYNNNNDDDDDDDDEDDNNNNSSSYNAPGCKGFQQALAIATVVFLLLEFTARLENLVDVVKRLQKEPGFKEQQASKSLAVHHHDGHNDNDENEKNESEKEKNEPRQKYHSSLLQITE